MNISGIGTGQASSTQQVAPAHHGHGHGMRKEGMDAAAKALDLSTTDLRAALKSGESLTSLAQAKGVSMDSLTSAITGALTKANPALTADRAQQIAQRMINGPASGQVGGTPPG